jgi:hypothetical protein
MLKGLEGRLGKSGKGWKEETSGESQEAIPELTIAQSPLLGSLYGPEAAEEREAECRFTLARPPAKEELAGCRVEKIEQVYVFAADEKNDRLRFRLRTASSDDVEKVSVVHKRRVRPERDEKTAGGPERKPGPIVSQERSRTFQRDDPSTAQSVEEFDKLSASSVEPGWEPIVKTRYILQYTLPNGHRCEIHYDEHHGHLEDFGRIEIEFEDPEDGMYVRKMCANGRKNEVLPDWIGNDVTDDKKYGSSDLAQYGVPKGEHR